MQGTRRLWQDSFPPLLATSLPPLLLTPLKQTKAIIFLSALFFFDLLFRATRRR